MDDQGRGFLFWLNDRDASHHTKAPPSRLARGLSLCSGVGVTRRNKGSLDVSRLSGESFFGGALFGNRRERMVDAYHPFPFVTEDACQALGEQYVVIVYGVAFRAP
jgi:hypothetical protein